MLLQMKIETTLIIWKATGRNYKMQESHVYMPEQKL